MSEQIEPQRAETGIFADEIGIEIGIYGDWRLKAAFKPIFACDGDVLRPIAVEGSMRPFVFGREVDARMFRRAVPPRDRPIVAAINAVLSLRNLQHTGVAGLKVLLQADFGTAASAAKVRAAARALAGEAHRNSLASGDVLVQLAHVAGGEIAEAAFAGLKERGIGVAFEEKGNGLHDLPAARLPDLVTIDGDWFRTVARQASTTQLFGALVRGYRSHGAVVLVDGVTTAVELNVALEAGADWLSGPLLAPVALAGAEFPEEPLRVESLVDHGRVIQLFR